MRITKWLIAGQMACAAAAYADELLNLDSLVYPGGTIAATVSPDGKHIAAIAYNGINNTLMLGDAETLQFKRIYAARNVTDGRGYHLKSPISVTWLGNDLMAVNFTFRAASLNLQGGQVTDLGEDFIGKVKDDDPSSTMVLAYADMANNVIARIDARTGTRKNFLLPSEGWLDSVAFDVNGEPRALTMMPEQRWGTDVRRTNWYKPSATANWTKLAEFKAGEEGWMPLYVPEQPDTLVVSSRVGRDTYAIFEYATDKHTLGTMMAGSPEVDILRVQGIEQNFRRVTTGGMKTQHIWFDSAWASVQASVDQALPNRINTLSGDPKKKVIIFSESDTDPGSWYVLDMTKTSLRRFGRRIEAVDPAQMQPMQILSYPARDGLKIPAYLTMPRGAKQALPAVILVHGGPIARDHWRWNREVQALASRGYVVMQPQFRGSAGFGRHFEESGYGQWGWAMQDDITDAVQYLVSKGIADPQRVCIFGSSYGGYAAMWGLAKTPDLFKCGISFAGVSDLDAMLSDWSDSNDYQYLRDLQRFTVGDIKTDKEKFAAVSPLKNAAKIKAPVLLMHANRDERVPISHGTNMRDALQRADKAVEWEEFGMDGHGLYEPKNQKRYLQLILDFLRKHIGDANGPP
jgi:dipeptidyl aminopeptidase/acylaminoacyl peptidase